jgi:hypothetical protein
MDANRLTISSLVLCFFTSASSYAEQAPEFPNGLDQWVNSKPISKEMVRGKAVFLWFFEET